jgi:hypothetical protein
MRAIISVLFACILNHTHDDSSGLSSGADVALDRPTPILS